MKTGPYDPFLSHWSIFGKSARALLFCGLLLCLQLIALPALAIDASIVIDANTDTVISEQNPDRLLHPASMTKLMTIYLVYERLKQGKMKLDDTLLVSDRAWKMAGSKMFVQVGTQVAVEDLIRGVIVQSGNDACIVFAEAIAGSEEQFAELMDRYGRQMVLDATKQLMDYTERVLRQRIAAIPDGEYRAEGFLDGGNAGADRDAAAGPRLEIGRRGQMIGMDMGFQRIKQFEAQFVDQRGIAANLFEYRVDDHRAAAAAVGQ